MTTAANTPGVIQMGGGGRSYQDITFQFGMGTDGLAYLNLNGTFHHDEQASKPNPALCLCPCCWCILCMWCVGFRKSRKWLFCAGNMNYLYQSILHIYFFLHGLFYGLFIFFFWSQTQVYCFRERWCSRRSSERRLEIYFFENCLYLFVEYLYIL